MDRGFTIDFRHSYRNLHIHLHGEFNGMCAWELIKIFKQQYLGAGRIFVNTAGLDRILPKGVDLFKSYMTPQKIRPDWLYFKGEKGFDIAPDGSRVLICKKTLPNPTVEKVSVSKSSGEKQDDSDLEMKTSMISWTASI